MKNICLGILAHVDAGKTSLCESLLYNTNAIKKAGRVDNKDTFLDTDIIEKARGITIYSKTALLRTENINIQLIDTPGHIDFSAELERAIAVLDYAILLISASDSIKVYTKTLFSLLEKYKIPTCIFVNKMDMENVSKEYILSEIRGKLSKYIVDFSDIKSKSFFEEICLANENLMNKYLLYEAISDFDIGLSLAKREIFPVFFGSALKNIGIKELILALEKYTLEYCQLLDNKIDFNINNSLKNKNQNSALVYKITRDETGNRLTHIKLIRGSLFTKQVIENEKINQIRIYNGNKYETISEIKSPCICVLTGLNNTFIGQNLFYKIDDVKKREAPLMYTLDILDSKAINEVFPKLKILNEEWPELNIYFDEDKKSIQINLMGEIQAEIIKAKIKERFDLEVDFSNPRVIYKETIEGEVLGLGHFEPLKHYAEVHLKIKALDNNSGIKISFDNNEELLSSSIRGSIISYLENYELKGVLLGEKLTDIEIKVIVAKIHKKHTEGGDIKEATFRALRQGLMQAKSRILEPYYNFELSLNSVNLGRALNDLSYMSAKFDSPDINGDIAVIKGYVPLANIRNYSLDLNTYTKGEYSLHLEFKSYDYCHNEDDVLKTNNYNPDLDLKYPSSSVFVSKGESFIVPWDKVYEYIHMNIPDEFRKKNDKKEDVVETYDSVKAESEELLEIFERTYGKIKPKIGDFYKENKKVIKEKEYIFNKKESLKEYFLIDAYNVIFAWDRLKKLALKDMNAARDSLIDEVSIYCSYKDITAILVFDAYKVIGKNTSITKEKGVYIVYTKTAETADQYIMKSVGELVKKYKVTVVTSDLQEQIIIRSKTNDLFGSKEFELEIENTKKIYMNEFKEKKESSKIFIADIIDKNILN